MDAGTGREVQATDPRRLRGAGQSLARDRAAVGRRHHRPGSDPRRAWPRLCSNAERADPRPAAVRRVQDVSMLNFKSDKPAGDSELEIVFDEEGAKQLIQLIEDCFKTGHEHLLPLDHGRWALTI